MNDKNEVTDVAAEAGGELYNYTECGLDNVWVRGLPPCIDDNGQRVYTIPNLLGLHHEIARCIVMEQPGMSGAEMRFLRTELGLTQDELSRLLHVSSLTVSRWERNETPIHKNALTVFRMHCIESLKLDQQHKMSVEAISELGIDVSGTGIVTVDGCDPNNYRAHIGLDAAA